MRASNRIISIGLLFLLLAWTPVGAAPPRQITWQELPILIGKNVSLVTPGGGLITGKVVGVDPEALIVNVGRTSDPAAYPKGEVRVPRSSLRTLEVRTKGRKFRWIGTFFGANAGIAAGYQAAIRIQGGVISNKHPVAATAALVGIAAGGTVAGYFIGNRADQRSTTYEILPGTGRWPHGWRLDVSSGGTENDAEASPPMRGCVPGSPPVCGTTHNDEPR